MLARKCGRGGPDAQALVIGPPDGSLLSRVSCAGRLTFVDNLRCNGGERCARNVSGGFFRSNLRWLVISDHPGHVGTGIGAGRRVFVT